MVTKNLNKTLKIVKDLILFDSVWHKRHSIKEARELPKKALDRIATYRDLVHNSFDSLMTNIYPNVYEYLRKDWKKTICDYIEKYPPNSPILNKVGLYFPEYLSKRKDLLKSSPFISELALYDWVELEIYDKEEPAVNGIKIKKNLFRLNPVHMICRFEYPIPEIVQNIEEGFLLKRVNKQKTFVFIYRDPQTLGVRFMELSPGALIYIELLEKDFSNKDIVWALAKHYDVDYNNMKQFSKEIDSVIKTLKEKKVILN